jgi:hypothetical protein
MESYSRLCLSWSDSFSFDPSLLATPIENFGKLSKVYYFSGEFFLDSTVFLLLLLELFKNEGMSRLIEFCCKNAGTSLFFALSSTLLLLSLVSISSGISF